jgi:hypothetical protein
MAEAVVNALAIIAEVPEVDQTLTLCGFVNPVHPRARLIELEDIDSLDAFGDFTDDAIENMAKRNQKKCEFTILSPISSTNMAGRPRLGSP